MNLRDTGEKLMGMAARLRGTSRSMVGMAGTCRDVADEFAHAALRARRLAVVATASVLGRHWQPSQQFSVRKAIRSSIAG